MNKISKDVFTKILSYFSRRCLSCHKKMLGIKYNHDIKLYWSSEWQLTKNKHMNVVCNWCYYYVYEYP
jgi:hypothetical protein